MKYEVWDAPVPRAISFFKTHACAPCLFHGLSAGLSLVSDKPNHSIDLCGAILAHALPSDFRLKTSIRFWFVRESHPWYTS